MNRVETWAYSRVWRSVAKEQEPVTASTFRWLLVRLLGTVGLVALVSLDRDGVLGTLAWVLVWGLAGSSVAIPLLRKSAYWRGFTDGRRQRLDDEFLQ